MLLGSPCKNLEPYDKPFWDIFEIRPFQVKLGLIGLGYLGAHVKMRNPMISLSGIYLKLAHFLIKIGLIQGVGGVPEICL